MSFCESEDKEIQEAVTIVLDNTTSTTKETKTRFLTAVQTVGSKTTTVALGPASFTGRICLPRPLSKDVYSTCC